MNKREILILSILIIVILVTAVFFVKVYLHSNNTPNKNPSSNVGEDVENITCSLVSIKNNSGDEYAIKWNNSSKKCYLEHNDQRIGQEYESLHMLLVYDSNAYSIGNENNLSFMVKNGEKIGKEYSGNVSFVSGGPVLKVENNKVRFLVFDGEEFTNNRDFFEPVYIIQNKLAYFTWEGTGKPVFFDSIGTKLYLDGKQLGSEYDYVSGIKEIEGRIALTVSKYNKSFVLYNGKEYGKEFDITVVEGFFVINDKIIFNSMTGGKMIVNEPGSGISSTKSQHWVVYGDQKFGPYGFVSQFPTIIDEGLAFIATDLETDNGRDIRIIIINGNEMPAEYDNLVDLLYVVDGKLAYVIEKSPDFYLVYNGKQTKFDYWGTDQSQESIEKIVRAKLQ